MCHALVVYQCMTHRFLGFKIAVFDEGQVNETKLAEIRGGVGPNWIWVGMTRRTAKSLSAKWKLVMQTAS